jgi:CRISPR-associated protein Cst2
MAFVTAMFLIDAPASALNNSGEPIPGARTENTSSVKFIRTRDGNYPYVSAQAFRYWLRDTLENAEDIEWVKAPIYREEKIAYTDANPIFYWDDDLLGYMRAPSKKKKEKEVVSADDPNLQTMTPLEDEAGEPTTVTRAAPFRVSTLVSIAPVDITNDWGTMSRQEGDPVPYEHQFYHATLRGAISFNLSLAGKFFYRRRTGFQNLDKIRRDLAGKEGLEHLTGEFAYRFWPEERLRRISSLLKGIGRLNGGAKQTIHYTDVAPTLVIAAVIRGGNNPFSYVFGHKNGAPVLNTETLQAVVNDLKSDNLLLSPVYVGWKPGYLPDEYSKLDGVSGINMVTPRLAFESIANWLTANPGALDA